MKLGLTQYSNSHPECIRARVLSPGPQKYKKVGRKEERKGDREEGRKIMKEGGRQKGRKEEEERK